MLVLLLYYRIITVISAIFAFFVFYLIVFKSPSRMNNFKWHLFNIQGVAFLDTFYWCIWCAPIFVTHPIPHGYPAGILQTVFNISTKIQTGFMAFLLGLIVGVLCVAFVFRYRILLPTSKIPFVQSFIEKLPTLSVTLGYGNGFVFGFFGYIFFLDEDGSAKRVQQADPSYVIPKGITIYASDAWAYFGACLALAAFTFVTAVSIGIVIHSKRILKSSAQSSRSIEMHKQALRSILLQSVVLYGVIAVPGTIFIVYMILRPFIRNGSDKYAAIDNEEFVSFYMGCYNLKSVCSSLVICYTIQPYRQYIASCFGISKKKNIVSQNTVTVSRLSAT